MAVKNAIYQVDNGSGFDEIHFKTKAEQVVCSDGKTTEQKLKDYTDFRSMGGDIAGDVSASKFLSSQFRRKTSNSIIQNWEAAGFGVESSNGSDSVIVGIGKMGDGSKSMYPATPRGMSLGTAGYPYTDMWMGDVNKAVTGYCTLPNGMLMQWGFRGVATDSISIALPIAFSDNNWNLSVTLYGANILGATYHTNQTIKSQFAFYASKPVGFYWMAIGW